MGTSVNVKVEQVTWANKDTPVNGPSTLSSTKVAVTNGSFSVPVNVTSEFYGYRISLTPATVSVTGRAAFGVYEGESFRVTDLRGRDIGWVIVQGQETLESAVARIAVRSGVYLVTPAATKGASVRMVVPTH